MKVLFLVRSVTVPGGWERYAKGLILALSELGVEPVIVASDPTPDPDFPFAPLPLRLDWAEWGRRQFVAAPLNLLKLRRHLAGLDLVHAVVEPMTPSAALAAWSAKTPYIITGHGTFIVEPFATGRGRVLARWLMAKAGCVACVSEFTRASLAAQCPQAPARAIPNGYTPPAVPARPERVVEGPYFLTVGPLKERKGQHLLLEAFARLAAKHPAVSWVIAGHSYKQAFPEMFKSLVANKGLTGRVKILGAVEEAALQALYRDCLFYALTPVNSGHAFEGFGLTYLEAGWWAKPSVATTGCGAGESVGDGREGFLVRPDDPDGLVLALGRLISDEALRQEMGAAARKKAEQMTWGLAAERMLTVYHRLLNR